MTVTKTEEGKEFPAQAYAYVPDPKSPSTWKIRLWETPESGATAAQVGRAMAAMGKGFRGNRAQIPADARAGVMAKIRTAWEKTHPGGKPADMPATMREAATQEFGAVAGLVYDALQKKLAAKAAAEGDPGYCCDIEALFPDRVIVYDDGRLWSYGYSIDDSNQVTLSEPQEVVENYQAVAGAAAMTESREVLILDDEGGAAFLEAVSGSGGNAWDAVLIRSGVARNNDKTFYPDMVLREAAPLFDGVHVFAKADIEHRRGDTGKDINKLVGWISQPRFVEGKSPDTGFVAGRLNFAAGASKFPGIIADAWSRGKKDLVGLSIDALGRGKIAAQNFRDGVKRIATAITKVNSVDLIVEPSAGGALVRLLEAADQEDNDMALRERMLEPA